MSLSVQSVRFATLPTTGGTLVGKESGDARPYPQALPGTGRLSAQEVEEVVRELNEAMQSLNTQLLFSIDRATNKTILRVIDSKTNEVIRQIPAEEVMRVAAHITKLLGVLYDEMG